MAKYHISSNGAPALCKAEVKPCPLGEDTVHGEFEDSAAAAKWAEQVLEKAHGNGLAGAKATQVDDEPMPSSPRAVRNLKKLQEYGFKASELELGATYEVQGSWRGDGPYTLGTRTNVDTMRTNLSLESDGIRVGADNQGRLTGQQHAGVVLGSILDFVEKHAGKDKEPQDRISGLKVVKTS